MVSFLALVGVLNLEMLRLVVACTVAAYDDLNAVLAILIALPFSRGRSHKTMSARLPVSRVCSGVH